ncbi:MAG: helix-turn-helix transcriptional regulator, partial [Actinomycetota bacterium]
MERLSDPGAPGKVLDLLCRMLDLTDDQVAGRAGMSRATVNNKRNGRSEVTARDLVPLADALDVDVEIFLLSQAEAGMWLLRNRTRAFA